VPNLWANINISADFYQHVAILVITGFFTSRPRRPLTILGKRLPAISIEARQPVKMKVQYFMKKSDYCHIRHANKFSRRRESSKIDSSIIHRAAILSFT